jgi:hypothetical protein
MKDFMNKNKKFIILAVCGLFILKGIIPIRMSEEQIMRGSFSDLFLEARKSHYFSDDWDNVIISDQAKIYIKSCCENRDKAIKLLKENGFQVKIYDDPQKVADINKNINNGKELSEKKSDYEEFISGQRRPGFWRFWDLLTIYEVQLRLKDNQVSDVWARTNTTYP